MSTHHQGRANMRAWEDSKPKNFFLADSHLQMLLQSYLGDALAHYRPQLETLGAQAATVIDENAKIEDQLGNHPRLERYNNIGERQEAILFHPNHHANGRIVWG